MKKDIINRIILSILLLFSGYLIGFVSSDCSSANQEIEYRIIGFNQLKEGSELEDELNKMGIDGWELIQVKNYMAIFKRK